MSEDDDSESDMSGDPFAEVEDLREETERLQGELDELRAEIEENRDALSELEAAFRARQGSPSDRIGQGCGLVVWSVGMGIAVTLTWAANHSIGWAALHGLSSWLYVVYRFLVD